MNFNDKNAVLIPSLKEGDKIKVEVFSTKGNLTIKLSKAEPLFLKKDNKGLYYDNVSRVYLTSLSAKITKI